MFAGQDEVFEARISYVGVSESDAQESTVRDIADATSSPADFRHSLCEFLSQFSTLSSRWVNYFETLTENFIDECAQFQKGHALRSTLLPTNLYDETTLIALSLRCFVISMEIDQVTGTWSTSYFQNNEKHACLSEFENHLKWGI